VKAVSNSYEKSVLGRQSDAVTVMLTTGNALVSRAAGWVGIPMMGICTSMDMGTAIDPQGLMVKWHALSTDHTVLPSTHAFIHERY